MLDTWEIMQRHPYFTVHSFDFRVLPFALMSNHYHMLVLAPHTVYEDQTLFNDVEGTLHWLNSKPSVDHWSAVRKGLKHPIFKLAKDRNTKSAHALETERL